MTFPECLLTLRIPAGIAAACSLSSTPTIADGPRLTRLAHLMADEAAGENAPILRLELIVSLSFGEKRIIFKQTKLEEVQLRFGGTIHDHDSASGKVIWLCFVCPVTATGKPVTIGFVSATGSADDHAVTLVAVQQVDAGKTADCAA